MPIDELLNQHISIPQTINKNKLTIYWFIFKTLIASQSQLLAQENASIKNRIKASLPTELIYYVNTDGGHYCVKEGNMIGSYNTKGKQIITPNK